MSDKPHLFYNNLPCCKSLIKLIKDQGMYDHFQYHDASDPAVLSKLPKTFTRVPILVVKGCSIPLVGKEVFTWLESQKFLNLTANNITKSKNPEFRVDATIGKTYDSKGAALNDADDDKLNSSLAYTKDWDKMISANIGKRFIDGKISQDAQRQKLAQLESERNTDLMRIMDAHKNF